MPLAMRRRDAPRDTGPDGLARISRTEALEDRSNLASMPYGFQGVAVGSVMHSRSAIDGESGIDIELRAMLYDFRWNNSRST